MINPEEIDLIQLDRSEEAQKRYKEIGVEVAAKQMQKYNLDTDGFLPSISIEAVVAESMYENYDAIMNYEEYNREMKIRMFKRLANDMPHKRRYKALEAWCIEQSLEADEQNNDANSNNTSTTSNKSSSVSDKMKSMGDKIKHALATAWDYFMKAATFVIEKIKAVFNAIQTHSAKKFAAQMGDEIRQSVEKNIASKNVNEDGKDKDRIYYNLTNMKADTFMNNVKAYVSITKACADFIKNPNANSEAAEGNFVKQYASLWTNSFGPVFQKAYGNSSLKSIPNDTKLKDLKEALGYIKKEYENKKGDIIKEFFNMEPLNGVVTFGDIYKTTTFENIEQINTTVMGILSQATSNLDAANANMKGASGIIKKCIEHGEHAVNSADYAPNSANIQGGGGGGGHLDETAKKQTGDYFVIKISHVLTVVTNLQTVMGKSVTEISNTILRSYQKFYITAKKLGQVEQTNGNNNKNDFVEGAAKAAGEQDSQSWLDNGFDYCLSKVEESDEMWV